MASELEARKKNIYAHKKDMKRQTKRKKAEKKYYMDKWMSNRHRLRYELECKLLVKDLFQWVIN